MTLITYPTRVHFGDGVLEEALRSELFAHGFTEPLILGEEEVVDDNLSQRIYAGLPRRFQSLHISIGKQNSNYDTARLVEKSTRLQRPDVIIAYGSARAISHARNCRHLLHQRGIKGGVNVKPVDIFAILGVDGLPNPRPMLIEPAQTLIDSASRTGLPQILICDPTAMDGCSQQEVMYAAADALSRALEAYLSGAYNPPADGMALEGVRQAACAVKTAKTANDPKYRRELMAASLNASLSQQKGIGPTQLISEVLREPYGNRFSSGSIAKILLPEFLKIRNLQGGRSHTLTRVLEIENHKRLDLGIKNLLNQLPLPRKLSELGLTRDDILKASEKVEDALTGNAEFEKSSALKIMESVF